MIEQYLRAAGGVKRELFFDAHTHLIVREVVPGPGPPGGSSPAVEEILYDDYRPVEGVLEPFAWEIRRTGEVLRITVTRVAFNAPVSDSIFDFPAAPHEPLPDIPQLLRDVEKNQKEIDRIKENYAVTRALEEVETDGSGQVKKKSVREYEVFYLAGREIATLTRRDGEPLRPGDQKKESERVRKRVEELQRRMQKKAESAGEEKEKDNEVTVAVFLRASRFVNPRRERFRGQNVIVFDFEPRSGYHPRTLAEQFLQRLVGVAWIDEQARDIARLEAYLNNSLKIGGGLFASVQKGSSFIFEQTLVNNEVWLPSYEEVHASARVLLVKGFRQNAVVRYSNYRKFRVESLSSIAPPKQD